jgi:hypothetical protein
MGAIGQPMPPGVEREPVYGEVTEIEQQAAGAPLAGAEGTQAAMPQAAAGVDQEAPRSPEQNMASPVAANPAWPGGEPQVPSRPVTPEQAVGIALMGLGTLSDSAKRFAMAMLGFQQPDLMQPGEPLPPYGVVYGEEGEPEGEPPTSAQPGPEQGQPTPEPVAEGTEAAEGGEA